MRRAIAFAMVLVLPVLLSARPADALSVIRTIPVGAQPFGVAAAGGLVYIANSGGSTVSIIDTASNAVTGSIAVGNGPGEIVVDGSRAYVGNFNDGTVSVVDTATRSTVATLSPGGLGVAVDPVLHRLYATSSARLTVFDTDTLLAVATLSAPATGGWWAVAVDATRHRVYLGDLGGGGITVVDGTSNTPVALIATGKPIRFALAVDPSAGRLVAASDTAAATAWLVNTATDAVVGTATVGDFPSHIAFDASHRAVVTDGGSNELAVVDPATGAVTRSALSGKPAGLAFAGTQLYVALNGSGAVALVGNGAPVVDSVTIAPAQPRTNDILTAAVVAHDPDGDPLTFTYQWIRNGVDLAGATAASLDLSIAGNGDRGDAIAVRVTANDGSLSSAPVTSALAVILDTAPVARVTLSPTSPTTTTVLVATASGSDADGDPLTFTYQWTRNGTDLAGGTYASLDLSIAGHGDRGDAVAVRVTASDGSSTSVPVTSAAVIILNTAPVASVTLSPTAPTTNSVMVATATATDADADPLTLTYTWSVNGVVKRTTVTSALTDAFDLGQPGNGNKGDLLTVELVASDGTLRSGTASASATVVRGH